MGVLLTTRINEQLALRVTHSLGVANTISKFLEDEEWTSLQALNKWFYEYGVPRVQHKFYKPSKQIYFLVSGTLYALDPKNTSQKFEYSPEDRGIVDIYGLKPPMKSGYGHPPRAKI